MWGNHVFPYEPSSDVVTRFGRAWPPGLPSRPFGRDGVLRHHA
jgi:hypothetical protein